MLVYNLKDDGARSLDGITTEEAKNISGVSIDKNDKRLPENEALDGVARQDPTTLFDELQSKQFSVKILCENETVSRPFVIVTFTEVRVLSYSFKIHILPLKIFYNRSFRTQ